MNNFPEDFTKQLELRYKCLKNLLQDSLRLLYQMQSMGGDEAVETARNFLESLNAPYYRELLETIDIRGEEE